MHQPRRAHAMAAGLATLAVALASLPMTATAAPAHASVTPAGIKMCGSFAGPHWSYKGASGTRYIVYTRHGGACAFAMKWAPRLVAKHPQDATNSITGGPSAWACANSVVHFGICVEEINGHPAATRKAFAWAGKK